MNQPAAQQKNTRKRAASRKRPGIQPDDLRQLVGVSNPQISPDGRQIVFVRSHCEAEGGRVWKQLWLVSTDGGPPRQFTSGERDGSPRWSPDGTRIAFVRAEQKSAPQLMLISAAGGEAVQLTHLPAGAIGGFRWSPEGSRLAVAFRPTEEWQTEEAAAERKKNHQSTPPREIDDLYWRLDGDGEFGSARFELGLIDAATGEYSSLFQKDTCGRFSFDWAPDGTELVVSANTAADALLNPWKAQLYRVPVSGGRARQIKGPPTGVKSTVRWSPDGEWIAWAGRSGREVWGVQNMELWVCRPDGSDVRHLTGEEDYCLASTTISDSAEATFESRLMWSHDSRHILLNFGWYGETQLSSISIEPGSQVQFHTAGRQTVSYGNLADEGRLLAVTVDSMEHPPEIAVAQLPGGDLSKKKNQPAELTRLTSFNTPLVSEQRQTVPVEPFEVRSASGTAVHGWVLRPPGAAKSAKLPAILTIHGGPHAQYGEAFFHEFQTFAAAGYVVVLANPRGSKGYGESHCTAIRGSWGGADWEDMQAIIEWMQQQPGIDSGRMGVTGGSYGGYLTNWIIGHTDAFAAAITDRCVSNLVSMTGSSDLPLVPGSYWEGNSWDQAETLWEQSPLKYFGAVTTPTLVIHSEGDLRCAVEQSEQVFAALKLRGIPTRMVRYPRETSHGMSRMGPPDLRIHRLREYLSWFDRYL
ncbi:MAG: S9 family peptidase [Planctomycetaceae bacterium]|nr:S9 family peptidase [Planctomycetaceae bacterium]